MIGERTPERHQRVIRALQAGPAAPEHLQRRAEAALRRAPPARRAPRGWRLSAVAAVGAAAVVAVVVAVTSLTGGAPSVEPVASFSDRPATQSTPAADPSQPTLLRREFAGVAFPNWSKEFGWKAEGARADTVGGRATETVFYTHEGHRINYTVLSGAPLDPPADAVTVRVGGVELQRFRRGMRDVVMFVRDGRTCVLGGHVLSVATLVKLASWQGDGTIRF
jgi:hypothetical protein